MYKKISVKITLCYQYVHFTVEHLMNRVKSRAMNDIYSSIFNSRLKHCIKHANYSYYFLIVVGGSYLNRGPTNILLEEILAVVYLQVTDERHR